MTGLESSLERFRGWFVSDCLPFWSAHGIDTGAGGFYEALNFDGTPSTGRPRRVRTLFRQVHTFTQAGLRGWLDNGEDIAAHGFEYLIAHACPDDGARGCVFHLADDGSVLEARRDLYDQAFFLLACASRISAGDARAQTLADKTIAFLDAELASPHGGWLESDLKETPRRQNPHMHLFEAFMALYRATRDERYLAYADNIYDLFCSTFYGAAHSIVREHFTEDWRPHEDDPIEPGHMLEWVWLLNAYERCGRRTPLDMRKRLYTNALAFGADPGFYGLIDNVAAPVANIIHAPKRLWPQTEYLRASLVMAKKGMTDAEDKAEKLIGALFETYFAVEPRGLWIDEFDGGAEPIAKDVPASILYHLFEAVAETDAYLTAESTP